MSGLYLLLILIPLILLLFTFKGRVRAFYGLSLSALIIFGIAFAQTADPVADSVGKYFVDSAAFGILLMGIVNFIKDRIKIQGNVTIFIVYALGVGISVVGFLLGLQPDNSFVDSIMFGIAGATGALTLHNAKTEPKKEDGKVQPLPERRG